MKVPWIATAACAALIAGCASAPPAAPSCCRSLDGLPFVQIADNTNATLTIEASTPSFDFPSGASRFVAFRLPAGPRPLMVHVAAPSALLPSSVLGLLNQQSTHFPPVVWLLDAQHRVVRREVIDFEHTDCMARQTSIGSELTIAEPPESVAFLVVSADPERLRASPLRLCSGRLAVEFTPVGKVRLRIEGLPVADAPVALQAQGRWLPDARRVGFVQDFFAWDVTPGRLVLGSEQLHYFERTSSGLQSRLALPLERLVSVLAEPSYPSDRVLVAAVGAAGTPQWHAFLLPKGQGVARAGNFAALLHARQREDVVVEPLALRVEPWPVAVDVVSAADPRAGGRVGQAVLTGGIVAALPCGLCQTGACTPEMLVTCAAAFTVGATLGGAWAIGQELLGTKREQRSASDPTAAPVDRRRAAGTIAAGADSAFDAVALQSCVQHAVAAVPQGLWREQGWTAVLQPAAAGAPLPTAATAREARIELTRVALLLQAPSGPDNAPADTPAWLQIDAQAQLATAADVPPSIEAFSWRGATRTLGQWSQADAATLQVELAQACQELGQSAVTATHKLWRRR